MDNLLITALQIPASIGVHAWEQQIKQTLVIDVDIEVDLHKAGHSDDLQHTLNYCEIVKSIETLLAAKHFNLIEAVAESVAKLLLQEFKVKTVMIQVAKPAAIKQAREVAVKITRHA